MRVNRFWLGQAVCAAAVLVLLCQANDARAYHAEAGLSSFSVTLTGPGLGYLSEGAQSYTFIRRRGEANGVVQDVVKGSLDYDHALGISDNDVLADTQGGASYSIGSVSSAASEGGTALTFSLGEVNAKAVGDTYNHAEAWLTTSFYFDVVGTPVEGSAITVTPSLGTVTFIEQTPPYADARLYVTSSALAWKNGECKLMDGASDLITYEGQSFGLNPFTIDLFGHVADGDRWCIGLDVSTEATVVPEPGTMCLVAAGALTLVGLALLRRRAVG